MSYDLSLYLKTLPCLSQQDFANALAQLDLTGELSPDFTLDGSLSPLCAQIGGLLPDDQRRYLAVTDYFCTVTTDEITFALPSPRRSLWKRAEQAHSLSVPTGSYALTFSCGMDSLEMPFALLIASAIGGKEGLLYDPQVGKLAFGNDIALLAKEALDTIRSTPADRLLLHEFEEWI